MIAELVAFATFVCTFGGALIGMLLHRVLPPAHFGADSKDTVKVTMGLVGSMTALVLGLVTASAKSSYDDVSNAVRKTSVDLVTLDRVLARYGPETGELRSTLKAIVQSRADEIWPREHQASDGAGASARSPRVFSESMAERIAALQPATATQRSMQARASELTESLLQERWLTVSHTSAPVPTVFLVIIVFWLTATFGSFGLYAPRNGTVLAVLGLGCVSVAASLFLVLQLSTPFEGRLKVSDEPMRRAIEFLGR